MKHWIWSRDLSVLSIGLSSLTLENSHLNPKCDDSGPHWTHITPAQSLFSCQCPRRILLTAEAPLAMGSAATHSCLCGTVTLVRSPSAESIEPPFIWAPPSQRSTCVRISYGWSLTSLFIFYLWDERTVKRWLETIKPTSSCDLSGI